MPKQTVFIVTIQALIKKLKKVAPQSQMLLIVTVRRVHCRGPLLECHCSCSCCSSSSSESSSVPVQPDKHFSQKKQREADTVVSAYLVSRALLVDVLCPHNLAFCHICRLAVNKAIMKMLRKRGHHVFITDGFSYSKKAKCSFKKHERSQLHREAVMKIVLQQQPSVATQRSRQSIISIGKLCS